MTVHQLDARRLLCPMPVIKVQNKVKTLAIGDQLEVLCTDPGTIQDIPCWCRMYGHNILSIDKNDLEIKITIQIGEK